MGFELTEDQLAIQELVRNFAQKKVKPRAQEIDKTGEFPWESVKEMAKMGLLGILIPQEYGGAGLDMVSCAIAIEEVSKACGSTGITMAAHNLLGTNHLFYFGTEEQKKKYVVPLAKGEKIGAWSLTEPNAGSDAGGLQTKAVLEGNQWVLNGSKVFTTNGHVADTFTVMAKTDPTKGTKGISAFIVEKGTPGMVMGAKEDKLGLRGSVTSEIFFDNCRIPKENLLGKLSAGFTETMKILDIGRIGIGAMALGIAEAALEDSIKYAKERIQFGQSISKFQAIAFMLADMATEIEAARLLVYRAASLRDQGKEYGKEASMAKLYASEVGMRATTKAIQIHGGYGYTKHFPVERYFRDVKLCEIGEGTSEIQRLVISRKLGL